MYNFDHYYQFQSTEFTNNGRLGQNAVHRVDVAPPSGTEHASAHTMAGIRARVLPTKLFNAFPLTVQVAVT